MQKRNRLTYDTVLEIPQNPKMQSDTGPIWDSLPPSPPLPVEKDEKCPVKLSRPEIDILLQIFHFELVFFLSQRSPKALFDVNFNAEPISF